MTNQASSQDGDGSKADSVFADYIDRLLGGQRIDVDQIAAEHPDLSDELIEQLRSFCDLADGPSAADPPNRLGDFEIIREIGRGGMGIVYEAWQTSLKRQVALKLLPTGMAGDSKTVARFIREAQVSGKLNHPNIVSVYGMGLEGHNPYYSMEFVDGETLAHKLRGIKDQRDDSYLSMRYCVEMANAFSDVADGLQQAHAKTVVHRDIKPSNLMFDLAKKSTDAPHGELRILDFGLARFEGHESLTVSGDVVGTVRYMSPEQAIAARSDRVDHRTDIYSLGASLYEAVTLRPPFEGKDIQQTLSQVATKDPIPPNKVNPRVPRDLDTIILKCLRKERSERYATAEALAQDLRRFVRGDAIEARPVSMIEQFTRKCSRQRGRIAAAIVIATLAFLSLWLNWHSRLAKQQRMRSEYPSIVLDAIGKTRSLDLFAYDSIVHDLSIYPWAFQPKYGPRERIDFSAGYEADVLLTSAIAGCPDLPDAYWHRCRLRFLLRQDEAAKEDLERVIEISPDHVPALFLKSSVQREEGDYQASLETFKQAEERAADPESWQYKWLGAQRAMQAANRSLATIKYPDAINVQPEPYIGWTMELCHQYSIALHATGNHHRALRQLARVSHQWPDALDVRVAEAAIFYELGGAGRELAESLFEELYASQKNPTLTAVIACREHTRGVKRAYCESNDDFMKKWLNRIDDAVLKELRHGKYLMATNQKEEGRDAFRRAIAARPTDAWLHYNLAEEYWNEPSIPLLRRATELQPDNVKFRAALSYFLAREGYKEEARELLSQIPQHSHRRMWDAIFVGLAWGTLYEVDKASNVFDEVSRINLNQLIDLGRGEMLYQASKRAPTDKASQELLRESIAANEKVIAQNPRLPNSYRQKIFALQKLGEHRAAVDTFEAFAARGDKLSHGDLYCGAKSYRYAQDYGKAFELYASLLEGNYRRNGRRTAIISVLTELLQQGQGVKRIHATQLVEHLQAVTETSNHEDAVQLRQLRAAAEDFLNRHARQNAT